MRCLLLACLVLVAACTGRTPSDTAPSDSADTGDTGAPWALADGPFTVVVLPDTQFLTLEPGPFYLLRQMMTWIVDHREEHNIAMVLQEGDVTHNNTDAEWIEADLAFSMLDGVVPYTVCVGNHDMESTSSRDTSQFNAWFGLDRWTQHDTFYAAASETSADDHAHVFSAGDVDWMVVSLAYDPTYDALAWAEELIASHTDHRVIVLTHAYLGPSGTTASQGIGIQTRLVDPFPHVRFVLNGHFTGGTNARRRRSRADGSEVVEIFANYQTLPLSGTGRMRRMRIDAGQGVLDVTSCDPFDACSDDDGDAFTLSDLDFD